MFRPFLFHTGVFFYDFIKAKCNAESFDTRARLKKLPMHFPFFLPLINCYNTWRLYRLRFGMKGFDDRNWKDVEEIQDQAGTAGMFESFTEAGPQSVIQLVIILSTGRISTAQKFGLPLSVISLTMASSRAFFIQRSRDERDQDPAMKTLLFRIYPRMLVIVYKQYHTLDHDRWPRIVIHLLWNQPLLRQRLYLSLRLPKVIERQSRHDRSHHIVGLRKHARLCRCRHHDGLLNRADDLPCLVFLLPVHLSWIDRLQV